MGAKIDRREKTVENILKQYFDPVNTEILAALDFKGHSPVYRSVGKRDEKEIQRFHTYMCDGNPYSNQKQRSSWTAVLTQKQYEALGKPAEFSGDLLLSLPESVEIVAKVRKDKQNDSATPSPLAP